MKRLFDDHEVSARVYYYLLDWNEHNNWEYIQKTFDKQRLCDLTLNQYKMLFAYATSEDYKTL